MWSLMLTIYDDGNGNDSSYHSLTEHSQIQDICYAANATLLSNNIFKAGLLPSSIKEKTKA